MRLQPKRTKFLIPALLPRTLGTKRHQLAYVRGPSVMKAPTTRWPPASQLRCTKHNDRRLSGAMSPSTELCLFSPCGSPGDTRNASLKRGICDQTSLWRRSSWLCASARGAKASFLPEVFLTLIPFAYWAIDSALGVLAQLTICNPSFHQHP